MSFGRSTVARLRMAGLVTSLVAIIASESAAKFKTVIDGITVTYSNDGADAYFDPEDGTLTVEIDGSGGALGIVVGPTAFFYWGDYVDIYILADNAALKSIKIKGAETCIPFVCGQVGSVGSFSLTNGVVGGTDTYGQDFGIGRVSPFEPAKISLKQSYALAQVLGYAYKLTATIDKGNGGMPGVPDGWKKEASAATQPSKLAMVRRVQQSR